MTEPNNWQSSGTQPQQYPAPTADPRYQQPQYPAQGAPPQYQQQPYPTAPDSSQYQAYPQAYPVYQQTYVQATYAQPPATDGVSIASFVTSLLGFNIVAVILGIVGLNRTKDGAMSGRGFAIAGIIIGSISLVMIIIMVIFMIGIIGMASSSVY